MSSLSDRIERITAPRKPSSFISWYNSLEKEDQEVAWEAMTNETLKNYTLYGIFRSEGLRMSKDNFVSLRKEVLAGSFKKDDINE